MVEFFLKKHRHRVVMWGAVFLCVVLPLLLLCSADIRERAFVPVLSKDRTIVRLVREPGCFYDAATDTYGLKGVPFGGNFKEVAAALEMDDLVDADQLGNGVRSSITLFTSNIKMFGSVYSPTFNVSAEQAGTHIAFLSGLMISEAGLPTRSYSQACDYVDEMLQQFLSEYGEPDETNFDTYSLRDVPQESESKDVYAVWRSADGETQLKLRAYKTIYTDYKRPKTDIIFQIIVGVSTDGWNW